MYQATQSNKFWSVGDVVGTFKYFKCGRTVYTTRASLVTKLTDLFPPREQSVLQEKLQVAVMNCLDINGNFPVSKFLDIVKKVESVTETPLEHSSPSNSGDEVQPIGLQHWCGPMTATNLSSSPSTSSFIRTFTLLELGIFGREGLKVLHSTANSEHQILYLCWWLQSRWQQCLLWERPTTSGHHWLGCPWSLWRWTSAVKGCSTEISLNRHHSWIVAAQSKSLEQN